MKYFLGKNSERFLNVMTPTLNDLFNHLSKCTSHIETTTLGSRDNICLKNIKDDRLFGNRKLTFSCYLCFN